MSIHLLPIRKKVTTVPASEPVTVSEAKDWCYVTGSDHDTLFGNLIKTARQMIEKDFGIALITQTVECYFDEFPSIHSHYNPDGGFFLPVFPVQSVTSITYTDSDGNNQTVSSSDYVLENMDDSRHRITLAYGASWPTARDIPNAVKVTVSAGYGNSSTDVPEPFRTAILLLVKFWYDNPEDIALSGYGWNRSAQQIIRNFVPAWLA
ncbi:MAG: hypothetical protein D6698_16795 [Gammaproteobacteria bacterium]|nr:MAG: hypothetical protein D6698_16795 [Gammaproteobacteria bacterium]